MNLATADFSNAAFASEPMPQQPGAVGGHIVLPSDFEELRLYALLISRFGKPNGMITYFGTPGGDPDGPFKWDFLFSPEPPLNIQVLRTGLDIQVMWWGASVTETEVIEYFRSNIGRHSKVIDDTIESLDHYTLLLNPYHRHKTLLNLASADLSKLSVDPPSSLASIDASPDAISQFANDFERYMSSVDTQASLTCLVVTEAAFMAEAYLNLMLAVLLRDEIRSVRSLFEESLRRPWQSKIQRLPVDCNHVTVPDMGDSRIRDAKTMFNLRNKLAHSYPDPNELRLGQMWFQHNFPILDRAESFQNFVIALHNQLPSESDAHFCYKAAHKLVEYLTDLISEHFKDTFIFASESNPLGYDNKKQKYGIPFGKVFMMGCLGEAANRKSE